MQTYSCLLVPPLVHFISSFFPSYPLSLHFPACSSHLILPCPVPALVVGGFHVGVTGSICAICAICYHLSILLPGATAAHVPQQTGVRAWVSQQVVNGSKEQMRPACGDILCRFIAGSSGPEGRWWAYLVLCMFSSFRPITKTLFHLL